MQNSQVRKYGERTGQRENLEGSAKEGKIHETREDSVFDGDTYLVRKEEGSGIKAIVVPSGRRGEL